MTPRRQKGFALTDALIAAAIAAGVAVTAAQSIGIAARSARNSKELSAVISEAEIINARIDAGMRNEAALHGLTGWTIESTNFDTIASQGARDDARPRLYSINHAEPPIFSFERVVVEAAR